MVRRQLGRAVLRCLEENQFSSVKADKAARAAETALAAAPACVLQRRGIVLPAQEESYDPEPAMKRAPLQTQVDRVGAVSVIAETDEPVQEGVYQNRDGHRFEDGRYGAFAKVGEASCAPSTSS